MRWTVTTRVSRYDVRWSVTESLHSTQRTCSPRKDSRLRPFEKQVNSNITTAQDVRPFAGPWHLYIVSRCHDSRRETPWRFPRGVRALSSYALRERVHSHAQLRATVSWLKASVNGKPQSRCSLHRCGGSHGNAGKHTQANVCDVILWITWTRPGKEAQGLD